MIHIRYDTKICNVMLIILFTFLLIIAATRNSHAHGGKSHGGTGFSSLQAVQKAIAMYDRLITRGKLSEDWETQLVSIMIGRRSTKEKLEYVVQFKNAAGDPESVYFFFDQKGEYTGSNFTGK